METTTKIAIKGGEFIVRRTDKEEVFIPEEFGEEAKMIAQSCEEFLEKEIFPHLDLIDSQKDPSLMPTLLEKAGALGLLGTSVPEEYGGFGSGFTTTMLVAEVLGSGHAFAVALGAHTGIGTLPIVYYGNEAQKAKYLPKLADASWKAAYCLTEPDAGSDANSGKTKAVLNAEGTHYLITGQKMWISNGGFADLFIVFAKIEDDKNLTAFIVEHSFPGITMNEEEHKMGIKGSSTRQIFFNDCAVPVENMLSVREGGFKIAVNILNIGRIKLAAAALGASKRIASLATQYANERKQFGVKIGSFGAIQYKLGEMAARIFATESANYRAAQDIENAINTLKASGMDDSKAKLKGTEQFAIECAMMKVHTSEVLDFTSDEGVQIYGGMGYSADAPMDRAYRDSRINRIFEGTNEINRMLAVGTMFKKAMKGEFDLFSPAMAVGKELMAMPERPNLEGELAVFHHQIAQYKKAILMIAGSAVQKFMMNLEEQQEILMALADMLIETYVAESTLLRVEKLQSSLQATDMHLAMLEVYMERANGIISLKGREAISGFTEGDEQRMLLMGLKRFTKLPVVNTIALRRKLASAMLESNRYCWS